MKKTLLLTSFLIGASLSLVNAFQIPTDEDGAIASNVKQIGVYVYTATAANNVASLLTGGTVYGETNSVPGSSVAIFGVLTSTANDPLGSWNGRAFVELRATNTANTSSELLVPPIAIISTRTNTFIVFDPPVIAPSMVSVNITTVGARASVFYRYLNPSVRDGVRIPIDSMQGVKAMDSGWYGVQPATETTLGALANTSGTEIFDLTTEEKMFTQVSSMAAGRVQWFGWMSSTGSALNYMVCKDTESVGNTNPANDLVVPIFYNTLEVNVVSANLGSTDIKNGVFTWPWPVIATRGLACSRTFSPTTARDRFRNFSKPATRLR